MGVPKFAAWLTKKYPAMVGRVCPAEVHGLYVDLNGLIHPCCHSEDDPLVALRPEHEKLRQICLAVETLVASTRPQHVIYIAADGVAPRAKMNQQRVRRYMSFAQPIPANGADALALSEADFTDTQREEAEKELHEVANHLLSDALYGGGGEAEEEAVLPDAAALMESFSRARPTPHASGRGQLSEGDSPPFDSNCISPGTEFMEKVSLAVREFLWRKLAAADPLWANATVLFSDASTPGEGEHKLLDFLRTQSSFPGFNGHGAHVIAGLDADLIFLSLSLHIPHVVILRDNKRPSSSFDARRRRAEKKLKKKKEKKKEEEEEMEGEGSEGSNSNDGDVPTTAVAVAGAIAKTAAVKVAPCTTYEYYDIDTVGSSVVSEVLCLCHIKGFAMKADVRDSAGGELMAANGYCFDRLTGRPDGPRKLGERHGPTGDRFHPCMSASNSKIVDDFIVMAMIMGNDFLPRLPSAFCGESAMDDVLEVYVSSVLPYGYLTLGNHDIDLVQLSRFFAAYARVEAVKFRHHCVVRETMTIQESASPIGSEVDARWRQPYYDSTSVTLSTREDACRRYVEGLRFVWRYYSCTSTQVSWSWFYPYYHGPFAYDLCEFLRAQGPRVQETLPPAELEAAAADALSQQLSILPPASKALLPEVFWRWMTHPPEDLRDTFCVEWLVDYAASYGKEHLAAVMLPFANVDRLRQLVRESASQLSEEERRRQRSNDFHFVMKRVAKEERQAGPTAPSVASNRETAAAAEGVEVEERVDSGKKKGPYVFEVKGNGLSALSASEASAWNQPTGCSEIQCYQLRETEPDLCRPRTYSWSYAVPNLTATADGRAARSKRKPTSALRGEGHDGDGEDGAGRGAAATPNFVAFAFSACGVALLVLLCTTSLCNIAVKVQVLGLLTVVLAVAYTVGFAVGPAGRRKGSGLRRNNVRMTFVDWRCGNCLCLNFSRNNHCIACAAPFDEHRDEATFSGVHPPDPPLMDPNHQPYLERFGFRD